MSTANPGSGTSGEAWRRSEDLRWAVLDPAGEPRAGALKGRVYSTVYVADELIINGKDGLDVPARISDLTTIANRAGWDLEQDLLEDGREPGITRSVRVRLTVAPSGSQTPPVTAETPDAWQVLRQARIDGVAGGVGLNHVLSTDGYGVNPFTANPFTANPFTANPFTANPFTANAPAIGIGSYGAAGFGNRQPVAYLGPEPEFDPSSEHPVVAIFDTGIGDHPWFSNGQCLDPVLPNGDAIGIDRPDTDPEEHPSLSVPLDGIFDDASGHGTFIAGIVRQLCPQAQILPVRVADGQGLILETELIGSLGRLIEYIGTDKRRAPVNVLNLSFSFYHETPDDPDSISEITDLLKRLREEHDVVVVCSAGNEATDRPTFPAALPDRGKRQVSVGALNPADSSVALFSNIGAWVDVYASGVSVVSTVPIVFNGGIQAGTRDDKYRRRRESLDYDDFHGGFGVWSGTSFAAPVVAGLLATHVRNDSLSDDGVAAALADIKARDHS